MTKRNENITKNILGVLSIFCQIFLRETKCWSYIGVGMQFFVIGGSMVIGAQKWEGYSEHGRKGGGVGDL